MKQSCISKNHSKKGRKSKKIKTASIIDQQNKEIRESMMNNLVLTQKAVEVNNIQLTPGFDTCGNKVQKFRHEEISNLHKFMTDAKPDQKPDFMDVSLDMYKPCYHSQPVPEHHDFDCVRF